MKKILLFIFIIIGFYAKSQEYDEIYIRNFISLTDSVVTNIATGDTLTTNEFVRILLSYAISNINENEIIVDSIRAKNDSIYLKSPATTENVFRVLDSIYASYLYVSDTGKFINPMYVNGNLFDGTGLVSLGTTGQLPYVNPFGTDLIYDNDLKYSGDTLYAIYQNVQKIELDTLDLNGGILEYSNKGAPAGSAINSDAVINAVDFRSVFSATRYGIYSDDAVLLQNSGTAMNLRSNNAADADQFYFNSVNSISTGNILKVDYQGGERLRLDPDSISIHANTKIDSSLTFAKISKTDYKEGRLYYCDSTKTLLFENDINGFKHNIGYEHVVRVFNNTGFQIDNGKLVTIDSVRINGSIASTVKLAGIYSKDSISGVGMATVDIPNQSFGIVTLFGEVKGLNTSAFNNAEAIYVDTSGYIRNTKPDPPAFTLRVGYIQYADNDSGQIYMLPGDLGYSKAPNFVADSSGASEVVTINTINIYEYLPLSAAAIRKNFGYTIQGDSVQIVINGDYDVSLAMSFQGNPASETWRYGIFVNNVMKFTKSRTTASSANGDVSATKDIRLYSGDWVSFRIRNESGTGDPTIIDMSYELKYQNE